MRGGPTVVCFSGSTKFIERMAVLMWEAEKAGKIAIGCHLLPKSYTDVADHLAEHEGAKATLDDLHLRKIDMSDELFVVNVGGYIGEQTAREIVYARSKGKPIEFLEKLGRVVGPSRRQYELRDGTLWANFSPSEREKKPDHWFPQPSVIQDDVLVVAELLAAAVTS